jgi:flagellar motor protein MotB
VSGRGANEPITSNASAAGQAQNRRVEIIITPTN